MSNKELLENIKKLRELTGVGFKDCKSALDESNGDIDKSIEFLRKKGIAKASKKMSRTASEGLVLVKENGGEISIIEVNSETDFISKGDLNKLIETKMSNGSLVKDNLVALIAKIGEKITIRRTKFFDSKAGHNFSYVHSGIEKNIGKIISVVKIEGVSDKNNEVGNKIAMHVAASSPIAIDRKDIKKEIIDKEIEIIKAEIINSGKPAEMAEKISKGKIEKFISENTLLNQVWIMDPKKKVSDILKEYKIDKQIKILDFVRFKVGEGV